MSTPSDEDKNEYPDNYSGDADGVLRDLEALEQSEPSGDANAFGDLGGLGAAADEVLHISADGLVARIWRLGAETTRESLYQLLANHNITFGIEREAIDRALEQVERGQVHHGLVVARGVEARVVDHAFIDYFSGIENHERDFAELRAQLQAPQVDLADRSDMRVCAVAPGDTLARWQAERVETGRTVRGDELQPRTQAATGLRPGTYVELSEDGRTCTSEIYGYAGVVDGRLQVVPPLWSAPGGLEVFFVHWPSEPQPAPPSMEQVQRILAEEGINYGIDVDAIRLVCEKLRDESTVPFAIRVARATLADGDGRASIHYPFDLHNLLTWDQMQALLRSGNSGELDGKLQHILRDRGLQFPLLRRGQMLAEKTPPKQSRVGRSVRGDEVLAVEEEDIPLQPGEFVELSADGLRLQADLSGYVCLRGDRVEVVPPVWVEPSAETAYFLNLPQGEKQTYPSVKEMVEILDLLGIQHSFKPSDWEITLDALRVGKDLPLLIPIAQATPHGESRDADFVWKIDIEGNRVGKILEDGSIDFRARNLAPLVREGELIGELSLPARGKAGRDVLGRELPAPQPINVEVVSDAHVRTEEDGAHIRFYALRGGEVVSENEIKRTRHRTRRRIRIGISLVSNIDGDVGYATGNVEFSGDVVISGSVQSLFSVRAEGSVHIGGYVEDGAIISAGKDILVRGGIIGAATQVEAGGALWAKFAQEASIRAGGDVRIGAYIFNASVRSCGKIIVLGRGEGKARALVGGLVWGGQGIEALSVGSPYNSGTRLVAGVDPVQVEQLEKLRADLFACEERMQAFMEALSLPSLDIDAIRARLRRPAVREKRRDALLAVKRLSRLSERRQTLRREMEQIVEVQRKLGVRARIVVRGTLYSGVEVRLGEESRSFQEEREHVQLRLGAEEGRSRVVDGPIVSRATGEDGT